MTYTPTNWVDGSTPLNRTNMKHIEDELVLLDPLLGYVAAVPPPSYGTSPPGSPVNGQLWMLPAGNGVWAFRYNAGSASAYKWEFVGGPPMRDTASVGALNGIANGPAVNLPGITVPRSGDYDVAGGVQFSTPTSVLLQMGFANNNASAPGPVIQAAANIAGTHATIAMTDRLTGVAIGNAIYHYYIGSGTSTVVGNAWINITPVRVS